MMIFFKDTEIERSSPAMIASYSVSLLEAGKFKRMAYSMISSVKALSCSPRSSPFCLVEEFLQRSQLARVSSTPGEV